jgi:hypothetical protein
VASSDSVKFILYTLLIGFCYGLMTFLYDIFSGLMNLNISHGTTAPISAQIMDNIHTFISIYPLFNLIFLSVMAVLVANARSEKLSPYFGINPWGILTSCTAICVAFILTYVVSILDGLTGTLATIFAVRLSSYWDVSSWLSSAFNLMHWIIIALIVLGYLYVIYNSLSVESQQSVV